jgi:hypothetical protein
MRPYLLPMADLEATAGGDFGKTVN